MADFVTLTRATATYVGEWSRDGEHCSFAVWCKDGATNPTERTCTFYTHGGAETNWEDIELGTNGVYLMLVNELDSIVVSYDVSPGWFQLEGGEGSASRDVFTKQLEHAAAISYIRTLLSNPDNGLLGGAWMSADPDDALHAGTSSGGYDVLRCQLMPDGSLPYSRDRVVTGDARFARAASHLCNNVLANIAQGPLSQFHEYVVETSGATTYLVNGLVSTGEVSIPIDGDTVELHRGNRVVVDTATSYVSSGTQTTNTAALAVASETRAIPRGCYVVVNLSGTDYTALVEVNYAGGAGSIVTRDWSSGSAISIPNGTPIRIRQEFAVEADSGDSPSEIVVGPSVKYPILDNSIVELQQYAPAAFGAKAWAQQYFFSSAAGYVWRSDDSSGNGFPMEIKRQADVDYMLDVSNPRVHELHCVLTGGYGTTLMTTELTGEESFLTRHEPGITDPWYIDLHDECAANAYLAWWLYTVAGNTNTAFYAGNRRSNINPGDVSVPWNLGRNSDFNPSVLKARLQARGW